MDRLGLRPEAGLEPIILAMKPLDGTIAHNAETWGVAGMNIDACRIGDNPGYKYNADHNGTTFHGKQGQRIKQSAEKKRCPVHRVHQGPLARQSPLGRRGRRPVGHPDRHAHQRQAERQAKGSSGDSGIYGSDANRTGSVLTGYWRQRRGEPVLLRPRQRRKRRGEGNDHATVKPLALMEYSAHALFHADGGVILDPFAGSGSTLAGRESAWGASASASNWTFITATSPSHASSTTSR